MVATFGLAILDSFVGQSHAQAMSWQQFASGIVLVGLVRAAQILHQGYKDERKGRETN